MIRIQNITKSFGRTQVLQDVSLDLPEGGVTALIGPNGAGKSTLLSIIARLAPADGGRVSIDGLDAHQAPSADLARLIAMLRQDNHLTARLTVRELIGFGRFPHSGGRLNAADQAAIDRAVAYLDLAELQHRFLDQLSGGQRQRAFVAMTIAQETKYLLLDEPLNNLDMKHARAMMRLLRQISQDLGKTVLVVLHDINFASCHADRIVAMKDGRIFATGTPRQIVAPEVLADLYETDIPVHDIDGRRIAAFYD
ncbi:ABC transporter ATP-binding protein [Paracoccus homiensis]|uniref:Iron complex transport system ATP-binding protein n=1 Tax=Paracoccus homiensis TaxID=364199 RepID=A0A1I0IRE6_9RHOB|nr:ATP-binding cassette domain-containing protein [Paracoccus homiensis]SET99809.1 iron complex transport system ATP-binding protein [Paracoccus homiensis]